MTSTRATLVPHPASPAGMVRGLSAQVSLAPTGRLHLHYVLRADFARLVIPPPAVQAFRDELWRHTCFEAFVGVEGAPGYRELNVAPSRAWAAYSFVAYREGMARLDRVEPRIDVRPDTGRLDVDVQVELAGWFDRPWTSLRLGLAAVLEAADGTRSYWALRHPGAAPDFHHRAGFMASLS